MILVQRTINYRFMKALINSTANGAWRTFVVVGYMVLSQDMSAQELIKDISHVEDTEINEFARAIDVKGIVFFNSFNDLWVTKGTRESSLLLKRFKTLGRMARVGPRIFFTADAGEGVELWRSDGTIKGTVLVKDIFPGPRSSSPAELTAVGNMVYFVAANGASGKEIWKSNGTASGTLMVKDILPGKKTSNPSGLTHVDGALFFVANDGVNSYELWKSDGSSSGTKMVRNINTDTKMGSFPKHLTNVSGVLYFTAIHKLTGRELWKSDGTSSGTVLVKDIVAGPRSTPIQHLTAVGNRLFFAADDRVHGMELWKSNGTSAGTVLVKDLTPGWEGSASRGDWGPYMSSFKNVNGKLYFNAYQDDTFYYWKSDGTHAGTVPFYKPRLAAVSPMIESNFTYLNDHVYFNDLVVRDEDDPDPIVSIYTLRENPSGTISRVSSLFLWDQYDSYSQLMLKSQNDLYMTGRGRLTEGYALFKTNGFSHARKVVDAYKQESSSPDLFTRVGNKLYFRATFQYGEYDEYGFRSFLYASDGTTAGTQGIYGLEDISEITVLDNIIYFIGYGRDGYDIYRSDGTTAGTYPLRIKKPPGTFHVSRLKGFKGKLYYFCGGAWEEPYHHLLVMSSVGTIELGKFLDASSLTASGDYVYFAGKRNELGTELYRSDGTVSGTRLVKDIFPGSPDSAPSNLTSYKDFLFFSANDGIHGKELWRSGGTPESTFLLKDLSTTNATNGMGGADHFQVANGQLYFTSTSRGSSSLWKSDGTSSGTYEISKIPRPVTLMDGGTILYFMTLTDGRFELWRSGPAGEAPTKLYQSNNLDPDPLFRFDYTRKDSTIYFITNDKLIQSNGTACGTFEIPINTYSIYPIEILGKDLIFGGMQIDIGTELFKMALSDIPDPCSNWMSSAETSRPKVAAVSLYPNPFGSEFTLQNADSVIVLVRIYDDRQNIVEMTEVSPSGTRSLGSAWKPGIYLVSVAAQGKTRMYRIVKKP